MNKNYLIFGLLFLLCLVSVNALTIVSPSNNSLVNNSVSLSFNRSIYPITNYMVYFNNSNILNISNTLYMGIGGMYNVYNPTVPSVSGYVDLNAFVFNLTQYAETQLGATSYIYTRYIIKYNDSTSYTSGDFDASGRDGITFFSATLVNPYPNKLVSNITTYTWSVNNLYTRGGGVLFYYDSMNYSFNNTLNNLYSFISSPGLHKLNVSGFNYSGSIVDSSSINVNLTSSSVLNVSVFNVSSLTSANISVGSSSCVGSSCLFNVVRATSYPIIVNNVSFALYSSSISIGEVASTNFNVSLLPNNALNVTIRDESTNGIVYSNSVITVDSISLPTYSVPFTINGSGVISNLPSNNYSLRISNPSFSTRTFLFSIPDRSFQNVSLYLNNGTAVLFNFKTYGGSYLSNVLLNVYGYVNSSLVLVESAYSSIDGRVQVSLKGNTFYSFTTHLNGYVDQSFSLNPILFSSYDVPLSPSNSQVNVVPSGFASFFPNSFRTGSNTSFTIDFFSPYDSFINYSYIVTYPSSVISGFGSSVGGESFNHSFRINTTGSVIIFYEWYLSNGVHEYFTRQYNVVNVLSNRTISSSQNNYGMLIGDLVLRDTFIMIFMFGLGWLAFGFFGSLALGGLSMGIILNTGSYTPEQSMIFTASFIIIVLLLIFRGRQ